MSSIDWSTASQRYFSRAIARVRQALQHHSAVIHGEQANSADSPPLPPSNLSPPSALEQLCQALGLSPFERDVLLLCSGMELETGWKQLMVAAQGDVHLSYPTLQLALAALPEANWAKLLPDRPLRRWRAIDIGTGHALAESVLRIDERILHALLGLHTLDDRLKQLELPVQPTKELVPSHRQLADRMAEVWIEASGQAVPLPVLQVCGSDSNSKRAIASTTCDYLGLELYAISADLLPTAPAQLRLIRCLCEREWLLSRRVLMVDCDWLADRQDERNLAIAQLLAGITTPTIVSSQVRRPQRMRPTITFDVRSPTSGEQRQVWRTALGEESVNLNGEIDALISHFNLSATAIRSVSIKAKTFKMDALQAHENVEIGTADRVEGERSFSQHLWTACREQARPKLDELAQRIDSGATWDDLVLPDKEMRVLEDIAIHVRQRSRVYEQWGFANKGGRGLGISALFAGASGTGKTLAAEVLGQQLQLDVYRIDLSAVVSKYIGETEKNLRRVFDAAEGGGAILLFDEADALFGKRSEVKDSHDRHANIEVSYLLQRMEAYRGLAILTTNLKTAIDRAFLRRIRFVIQFPFPDVNQREAIWLRMFPEKTPIEGVDYKKLAKLNVAGGNIRNIALNAAFIAADANEPVQMKHLLRAVKAEFIKLERSLTDSEVKGWI